MGDENRESGTNAGRGADGRFLRGNQFGAASNGGAGGRPRSEDAEKLRAALGKVVDNGTMQKWAASMKRRIEKGDQWATEFLFQRLLGKVPDNVEVSGRLEALLASWASGDLSDTPPTDSSE